MLEFSNFVEDRWKDLPTGQNRQRWRLLATGTECVCNVCTRSIINHEVEFKEQTEQEKQYILVAPREWPEFYQR